MVARLLRSAETALRFSALTGGVSSDIWRVDAPRGTVCAKRALPRLKVADEWLAPTRRNAEEAKWLRLVAHLAPGQVPDVLAEDANEGVLLLTWLDPAEWRNWKAELLAGRVDVEVGAALGRLIGTVHAATSNDPGVAPRFDNMDLFEALRVRPYFVTAAERNPLAAKSLSAVCTQLRERRSALVHGDVSPKNVLVRDGKAPVLLDAECATWGDPTFDIAFMLSHLMLKAIHRGTRARDYTATARACWSTHVALAGALVHRPQVMTAALLLARVDGKSPVEYLSSGEAARVRELAVRYLNDPPDDVPQLLEDWEAAAAR